MIRRGGYFKKFFIYGIYIYVWKLILDVFSYIFSIRISLDKLIYVIFYEL